MVFAVYALLWHEATPVFRRWVAGSGWGLAAMLLQGVWTATGPNPWMGVAMAILLYQAAWHMEGGARQLQGRTLGSRWHLPGLATSIGLALTVAWVTGVGTYAMLPSALLLSLSLVDLAVAVRRTGGTLPPNVRRVLVAAFTLTAAWTPLAAYLGWLGPGTAVLQCVGTSVLALVDCLTMAIALLVQANAELRTRNAQLVGLQQVKLNFLSTISHELRTPLTSIIGYLEFLEEGVGGPLSPGQAELVAPLRAGAEQLAALVESLLDSVRLQAGRLTVRREPVDLSHAVDHAVRTLGALFARRKLVLEVEAQPELPRAAGDPLRVGQVLANLLGNAAKFTPPGGHVVVRLRRAGAGLAVDVADDGVGIPADALERIFEPFFRSHEHLPDRPGGSGLGLAIARGLVEAMGGLLTVESRPGLGSTFTFTLPAWEAATAPAAPGGVLQEG